MKISARRRKSQAGQAILLVVLAMSIFLLGAVGFAIDGSHLYAQRRMAQAAADAAAQAAILSIFNGSNGTGGSAFAASAGTTYTCNANDARTPCYYAQTLNGFNEATDSVTYTPNQSSAAYPNLSASDNPNILQVTVARQVQTTLMRLLGPSASTIGATATAAIVGVGLPAPILVTNPTQASALSTTGSPTLTVFGGGKRSIEVNSSSTSAFTPRGGWTIDLSHAGPSGTGADFGVFGGPGGVSSSLTSGTGNYIQPASPVADPLAAVSAPAVPGNTPPGTGTPLANGAKGCPATPRYPCRLYAPGLYPSGITVTSQTAVFEPGIYYITSGGFTDTNGDMVMAAVPPDPVTGWTGNVLFYNTGSGTFTLTPASSASNVTLVGSPGASAYQGILFFEDRAAAAASHQVGGDGPMSLTGTIYLPGANQSLNLVGGAGTTVSGSIIAGILSIGGVGNITVNLSSSSFPVRQVALVN